MSYVVSIMRYTITVIKYCGRKQTKKPKQNSLVSFSVTFPFPIFLEHLRFLHISSTPLCAFSMTQIMCHFTTFAI